LRIITIDPLNARDFDDALSIKPIGDNYEVGVHIADAGFFVEEGSYVDEEAKKRTTSVYLVHRVVPMLPRILCENLCSLNPGCERLTFTLWIILSPEGKVVGTPKISRSVIKSKARFTYEQAQMII
jgi:DIS3-like exonuclease 2